MNAPVTYVELNSPDLEATTEFVRDGFGWEPQPFAAPDYLVAPHGDGAGIDAGLLASRVAFTPSNVHYGSLRT